MLFLAWLGYWRQLFPVGPDPWLMWHEADTLPLIISLRGGSRQWADTGCDFADRWLEEKGDRCHKTIEIALSNSGAPAVLGGNGWTAWGYYSPLIPCNSAPEKSMVMIWLSALAGSFVRVRVADQSDGMRRGFCRVLFYGLRMLNRSRCGLS